MPPRRLPLHLLASALAPRHASAAAAWRLPPLAAPAAARVGGGGSTRALHASPAAWRAALPAPDTESEREQPLATAPTATTAAVAAALAAGAARPPPALDALTALRRPSYTASYLESVAPVAKPATTLRARAARAAVRAVRVAFDRVTGYNPDGPMTEAAWLRRTIFLETVAGVPGLVAGALRHLRSLRLITYDKGWINTLLEEAENERMHLLTFMEVRQPGPLFRAAVLVAQGAMWNFMFVSYLISPAFCHAAVGYLEEEAVKTYTHALAEIDAGRLWPDTPVPPVAREYWRLADDATMRDVVLAIRADEACHSHVNHTFSELEPDAPNPFALGAGKEAP